MEKLELRHIAPYLPYGLDVRRTFSRDLEGKLTENDIVKLTVTNIDDLFFNKEAWLLDSKIILKPLSDLTKEIEHNGERFVPLELCCMDYTTEVDDIKDRVAYWQSHEHTHLAEYSYEIKWFPCSDGELVLVEDLTKDEKRTTQLLNYDRFFQLCEWHFDVFGLIEKGLAIDYNKVN